MISTQQNHKKQCHEGLGRNYAQTFSLIYSKKPSIFILITKLFVILQPKIGGANRIIQAKVLVAQPNTDDIEHNYNIIFLI